MPATVETIYRNRLRADVVGEAIWEANDDGEVGDIGYMHYDGRFHKLYNIFDGNEIIPALPDTMRTRIRSQLYNDPKSYGATFRTEIGAGVGTSAHIIVANVQFSVGNRSAAFLHPRSPTTEKWFEATGRLSTYLMDHESEIEQIYSPDHDFDTIWIIEATIHAASYRHGVVYSRQRSGAGTLEMHPIVANGASVSIHYTTEDLHSPIVRGRECEDPNADMHCIALRPVRLRKRRYLKLQSTKLLVSVTSAFRSALGGLFRSSASTSNPSTDRSLTRRGGDGRTGARDEAGESHATDSLEDSVIGPFEDDTARDTIDMVLDCILDDHPELDGVLVDSSFRFDERMLGSDAATFRHEVLIVETHSTPTGRFAIVKWESLDCQSCGTRCYGRVGLIQHVAGCVAHQQLLSRIGQEWAQRAQRAKRVQWAHRVGVQQQLQDLAEVQQVQQALNPVQQVLDPGQQVQEDVQEPAESLAVEQAVDLVRQVLEDMQDPALVRAAESAMEKLLLQVEQGELQPLQQELLLQQLGQLPAQPLPQQLEQRLERLERRLEQYQDQQMEQQLERTKQQRQLEQQQEEAQHHSQLQRLRLQWQLDQVEQLRQSGKWQKLRQWEQRWELQQLQEAQVQVHRAHQFHQAQKHVQKAQKRAQGELRW